MHWWQHNHNFRSDWRASVNDRQTTGHLDRNPRQARCRRVPNIRLGWETARSDTFSGGVVSGLTAPYSSRPNDAITTVVPHQAPG